MKLHGDVDDDELSVVAPCAGAWVEIDNKGIAHGACNVAPCAGAWVEISLAGGLL